MAVYCSDIILDDDEEEEDEKRRKIMFSKIDKFVDQKLGPDFVPFKEYLASRATNNRSNQSNVSSSRLLSANTASLVYGSNKMSSQAWFYKKPQPIKHLEHKETPFKSYDFIMRRVRSKFRAGYYTDVVTHMKQRSKRLNRNKHPAQILEDEDSSSESEDEEAKHLDFLESIIYQKSEGQISSLYWQLTKILRYIRISNVHATLLCLCYMNNGKLKSTDCMRAMEDSDGVALLLNLLSTNDLRCRIGSLKIIRELSNIIFYCRNITFLGGIQPLVDNLKHHNGDLQCLAAEILAKMAVFKRARSNIRRFDGINHLVYLLDVDLPRTKVPSQSVASNHMSRASVIQRTTMQVSVTQNAATALWKVSKSRRNRICMRKAGLIPLLAKLLHTDNQSILVPVIGTLQQCASELYYRVSIRTEGMLPILVRHLASPNNWLRTQSALTIFKCAIDPETRALVRQLNGTDVLIANIDVTGPDHDLLYAVTGAIWKICLCPLISAEFIKKGGAAMLIDILETLPASFQIYLRPTISASSKLNNLEKAERTMVNVTGALQELARLEKGRRLMAERGATLSLIGLLAMEEEDHLLLNTVGTLQQLTAHPQCLAEIRRLDGVPKLFAMTRHRISAVVAAALEALRHCFANMKDSGELVKTLAGAIELTVKQLESTSREILATTCSLIAEIGRNPDNKAVLTDLGVVRLLARLVKTDDDSLRQTLSEAIAVCCDYKDNREQFGRANVITPLVDFLRSSDTNVHATAARALFKLSQDANNSREMNQAGVSHLLINMIGSDNPDLQVAAAGAIGNLRKLGIETEKHEMMQKVKRRRRKKSLKTR